MVGRNVTEAKAVIESERPGTNVVIVEEGSMVTMDYNANRVRIFRNAQQQVARPPRIG